MKFARPWRLNVSWLRSHLLLLILCAFFFFLGAESINDLCIYTPDSARYLVWAKSLASFDGYKDATLPDPLRYVVHAPLYSLLLVPVARMYPLNIVAAKFWTLLFGVVALLLFYRWTSRLVGKGIALAGTFVLALNPLMVVYSTEVLSDVPFAVCLIIFFMLFDRLQYESNNGFGLTSLWISAVIACGMLCRELGVVLLMSAMFYLGIRKQWKNAVFIAIIPLVSYGLWYFRNEILVAPLDMPEIKNAQLLTAHLFTSSDASLFHELYLRASTNVFVYAAGVGKLLFTPFYWLMQYDVAFYERPPLSVVYAVLKTFSWPLAVSTILTSAYGAVLDMKRSRSALLRLLFLFMYVIILLVYPVNDVRFLFPLLFLMLFYALIPIRHHGETIFLSGRPSLLLRLSSLILVFILCIPNLVWDVDYASSSRAYATSPQTFYNQTLHVAKYPTHFTMPFSLAGDWISSHADTSDVIMSQWKEMACWAGGRKVLCADHTVPLDYVDFSIRDYHVRYIVSVVQKSGAVEFGFQMASSQRYDFKPVASFANILVFEAFPKARSGPPHDTSAFANAARFLNAGRYEEAEARFTELQEKDPSDITVFFYLTIAKEFNRRLPEAYVRFESLKRIPQSLIYLSEASVHQRIIALLLQGERSASNKEKAECYFKSGAGYWGLGYHFTGYHILKEATNLDSTFLPAHLYGIDYALILRDTVEARRMYAVARRIHPEEPNLASWGAIFSHFDSLRQELNSRGRSRHHMIVSRLFAEMQLRENAVDYALLSLEEDANNVEALRQLAALYAISHRYAPALRAMNRVLEMAPQDPLFLRAREAMLEHF